VKRRPFTDFFIFDTIEGREKKSSAPRAFPARGRYANVAESAPRSPRVLDNEQGPADPKIAQAGKQAMSTPPNEVAGCAWLANPAQLSAVEASDAHPAAQPNAVINFLSTEEAKASDPPA